MIPCATCGTHARPDDACPHCGVAVTDDPFPVETGDTADTGDTGDDE